jgi:hypothetical protein
MPALQHLRLAAYPSPAAGEVGFELARGYPAPWSCFSHRRSNRRPPWGYLRVRFTAVVVR